MSIVDTLTQQILAQGTSGQWSGEGFGSKEANARAMAGNLAAAGITRLEDFGQRIAPVERSAQNEDNNWVSWTENAPQFYNKATGQAIPANYDRAGGNIWSGTFAGSGSTSFGVNFNEMGMPIFYTQFGGSTSDWGNISPMLTIASLVPGVAPFAMALNAIGNAANGNTVGAVLSALGAAGSYGANFANSSVLDANIPFEQAASNLDTFGGWLAQNAGAIQTATQAVGVLNAVNTKNYLGVISGLMNIAPQIGVTIPSELIKPVATAATAAAISQGDWAGALNSARIFVDNPTFKQDMQLAAQGAKLVSAIQSGDPSRIFSSAVGFAQSNNLGADAVKGAAQQLGMPVSDQTANELANSKSDVFDPEAYAAANPDLQGLNAEQLTQHFLNYGAKEGRAVNSWEEFAKSTDPMFDPEAYAAAYGDLKNAFGNDEVALSKHFATMGIKEGRAALDSWAEVAAKANPNFDVQSYLNSNEDLKAAFGNDLEAAAKHFATMGITEGRDPNPAATQAKAEAQAAEERRVAAQAEADRQAQLAADAKAQQDREAQAKAEELQRLAQEEADKHAADVKAEAQRQSEEQAKAEAQRQAEIAEQSKITDDLQNAGLTENPDFAQPGAVDQALADFQKSQEAAALAQAQTPDVQEAKSNYTGEYSGMYFDPTYVDSDGNTGAYRQIPTAEEGAGGAGAQTPAEEPSVVPSEEPGTTIGGEATVPTAEEQQGSIDELLKELAPNEQQPVGAGTEPGVDQDVLDALNGAGLTEQPVSPVEIPTTPVAPTPAEPEAPVVPEAPVEPAIEDVVRELRPEPIPVEPEVPATPVELGTPAAPETPSEPEIPVAPEPEVSATSEPQAPTEPETPVAPTTQAGVTADEVQTIVDQALQNNPSLTEEQVRAIVQDVVTAIPEGLTADTVQQLVDSSIADMSTGVQDQIGDVQTTLGQQIGDVQSQLQEQIKAAQDAGMQGDSALQAAINSVAANTDATRDEVLAKLGTTEDQLRQDFSDQLGGVQEQIGQQLGDVQSQLQSQIQAAQDIGLEGDAALQAAIDSVATNVGATREEVLSQLGTTEEKLRQDFATQLGGVQEQLGNVQTGLQEQIGGVQEQLAGVGADLRGKYGELSAAQQKLADDLQSTGVSLQDAIDLASQVSAEQIQQVQQELGQQFEAGLGTVTQQMQEQYAALTAAQQAEVDARTQMGQSMSDAIAASQASTGQQISDLESSLSGQIGAQGEQFQTLLQQYRDLGMSEDAAMRQAIDDLGSTLGGQIAEQGSQYQQGLSNLEQQFKGMYDSSNAATQDRFNQLSADQQALAASMASSTGDLQAAIDAAAQQTSSQFTQLEDLFGGQLTGFQDTINQRITDLMEQQGLTQAQAQAQVDQDLSEMRDYFGAQLAGNQQQTQQALGGLGTQIGGVQTALQQQQAAQQAQNAAQQAQNAALQQQQAAQNTALQQQIAQQGQSSNLLALLGLLGGSQAPSQQAVQTPVADVKSFEDLGFGELFGSKLQFSDGGEIDELLNILKG